MASRKRKRNPTLVALVVLIPLLAWGAWEFRSMLKYGPQVGVPRIIEGYRRYGLKQTFFVPAWCIEHYPEAVDAMVMDAVCRSSAAQTTETHPLIGMIGSSSCADRRRSDALVAADENVSRASGPPTWCLPRTRVLVQRRGV